MNRWLRPFVALMLSLVVVLTAQTAAIARGQAPADDRIVLCIGLGTATVWLDEDGNPTSAPHICPDAALTFVHALLPVPALPEPAGLWVTLAVAMPAPAIGTAPPPVAQARGPPLA